MGARAEETQPTQLQAAVAAAPTIHTQSASAPVSDRDLAQAAYAAQLRFLDVMHRLELEVTAGKVVRSGHGGHRVHLGTVTAEALDRLSDALEGVAYTRRVAAFLGSGSGSEPETGGAG